MIKQSVQPVFDAHLHIIDQRFPLVANSGYLPPQFTTDSYCAATAGLTVCGGAVVSGSFQAMDQSYLRDALDRLGPTFVGVTQLARDVEDAEIIDLDRCGVRAIRFNLHRGGSEGIDAIAEMAARVHDLVGWHAEFYVDARELAKVAPQLRALPQIVIDHLGLSAEGLPTVLELVAHGAKVKATGFGRLAFDVAGALRAITDIDPHALLFGTDLPSTRAPRPFMDTDVALVAEALGEEQASMAFYDNAVELYRPRAAIQEKFTIVR